MPDHDGVPEELCCPICKEYYEEPRLLHCLHTFCKSCLDGVATNGFVECPVCHAVANWNENGGGQLEESSISLASVTPAIQDAAQSKLVENQQNSIEYRDVEDQIEDHFTDLKKSLKGRKEELKMKAAQLKDAKLARLQFQKEHMLLVSRQIKDCMTYCQKMMELTDDEKELEQVKVQLQSRFEELRSLESVGPYDTQVISAKLPISDIASMIHGYGAVVADGEVVDGKLGSVSTRIEPGSGQRIDSPFGLQDLKIGVTVTEPTVDKIDPSNLIRPPTPPLSQGDKGDADKWSTMSNDGESVSQSESRRRRSVVFIDPDPAALPPTVLANIFSRLNVPDLCVASQVCRVWRVAADEGRLWASLYLKRWPDGLAKGPPKAESWKHHYAWKAKSDAEWTKGSSVADVLSGHYDSVLALQVNDPVLVTASRDFNVRVWDLSTGVCVHVLCGHLSFVKCLAMHGWFVVSGSVDKTLRLWDVRTGECVHVLRGHHSAVWAARYDGQRVVSASEDKTIKVWDAATGTLLNTLRGHKAGVWALETIGERYVASGSGDGTVRMWDVKGNCLNVFKGHHAGVTSLIVDGYFCATGDADGVVRLWDLEKGACVGVCKGHCGRINDLRISYDQDYVISASDDATIRVWDTATTKVESVFAEHELPVTSIQVDSRKVISCSEDKSIKVWDLASGRCLRTLKGHADWVTCIEFEEDKIVSGSLDGTVRIWRFQ